jgi:hypothetical protein
VKYAFIERHRRDWPVSTQCSVLDVSVRGFQQYLHRKKMPDKGAGRVSDMALLTHINEPDQKSVLFGLRAPQ